MENKIFVMVKNWDCYNEIIEQSELKDFLDNVKKQTGAKRLHVITREVSE